MTAPINLDGTTSRDFRALIDAFLWHSYQAAPVASFIAAVDDVNERLAALDADLAKMEAGR